MAKLKIDGTLGWWQALQNLQQRFAIGLLESFLTAKFLDRLAIHHKPDASGKAALH
ncbi:hypothetical protein [Almyronema epifaneia]|uniref:Uncharacterized protein n=1 Tax=Almyronema epifaneia S1 TaxID=2991925 RepID=A0ABW6IL01_9CYAN